MDLNNLQFYIYIDHNIYTISIKNTKLKSVLKEYQFLNLNL